MSSPNNMPAIPQVKKPADISIPIPESFENYVGSKRVYPSDVDSSSTLSKKPNDIDSSDEAVQKLKEAKLRFIKAVHQAIVKKFGCYGIVLTLLASVTFVGILQPPGSFANKGDMSYMRSSILDACFLFFSTLSFLLACTGLLAVVAGTASMFRPGFFLNSDLKFSKFLTHYSGRQNEDEQSTSGGNRSQDEELEDPQILAFLVLLNLNRSWRLRVYMVLSLLSCVVAFACGAFAVIDWTEKLNGWFLVGAMVVGGVAMVIEVVKSGTRLTACHSGKWLDAFHEQPATLQMRHLHSQTVSRILQRVTNSPRPQPSRFQHELSNHSISSTS